MNARRIIAMVLLALCVGPLAAQQASIPATLPSSLTAEQQRKIIDEIPARMVKDLYTAKETHYQAVEIGPAAVPALVKVLQTPTNPDFARAWAATALAKIGGEGAVDALAKAVMDPVLFLRETSVYYGLKMHSDRFDNIVHDLAVSGQYPEITGWAVAGYLSWRDRVPDSLMREATGSDDFKVRAGVANVLNRLPTAKALPILRKLVQDEVPSVRMPAASALARIGDTSPETIDAILAGLEFESEMARQSLVSTLMRLTGQMERKFEYNTGHAYEENIKALAAWKQWWGENRSKFADSQPAEPQPASAPASAPASEPSS